MRNAVVRGASLLIAGLGLLTFGARPISAQVASVSEMIQQKDQWKKYAEEGRKLQFEGRFQGRAADTFLLEKFDLSCRLPSNIKLPDRMRAGQRLEVTGKLISNDGKLSFLVSRLAVRDTDVEQIIKLVNAIPAEEPDQLLSLAEQFVPAAEFYGDKLLQQEIIGVRTRAVTQKRKNAAGDLEELKTVLSLGQSLNVDQQLLSSLRFETLFTEWQNPGGDLEAMLKNAQSLEGWDRLVPETPQRLKNAFPKKAVATYDSGSADDRKWLHRLFFVAIRLQQIQATLKADGSNGLMLAELVRREFPGETATAAALEEREVGYQLGRVDSLTRQELQQLTQLLTGLSRKEKIPEVIEQWMTAQERRFGTANLPALLRTADEHLFVAELLPGTNHQQQGIELLKQAWSMASLEAPQDAGQIADRLKRLGWEQLDGRWMTTQQVRMLPENDIQLAVREGRVVQGMTVDQVIRTLGQPARISRLGSSRLMRELWVYDADGDSGLVVRFRRSLISNVDDSVVEDVSRISATKNR